MIDGCRLLRITRFVAMKGFSGTMVVMTASVRGPRTIGARLQMRSLLIAGSDRIETAGRISLRASNVNPSRDVAQQQRRQGQASDRRTDGFQLSVPGSKMNCSKDCVLGKSLSEWKQVARPGLLRSFVQYAPSIRTVRKIQ
jgi:hypothetical protein